MSLYPPGGFQTVAVVGFLSPVAVILFGPFCGRMMDFTPRRRALRFITCTQTAAIVTAGTASHHPMRTPVYEWRFCQLCMHAQNK